MWSLLGVMLVPLVVGAAVFLRARQVATKWRQITWRELLIMEVIALVIAAMGFFFIKEKGLWDTEHWNGRISSKISGSESCCHCTETCSTCTDSEGRTSSCNCIEICSHSQDYYWGLKLTTGDTIMIEDCVSSQYGVPPIWIMAKEGEPASAEREFKNYLKADPENLKMPPAPVAWVKEVPDFPRIYNHYKVTKVVAHGVDVPEAWDAGLREINADLGAAKQVDVTLVATRRDDPRWADAVRRKWLYGPKNALIIVVGVPDEAHIAWVRAVSISEVEVISELLGQQLVGLRLDQHEAGLTAIRDVVRGEFQRTPMADFKAMASAAEPPWPWLLALHLVMALITGMLGHWVWKWDVA